MITFAPLKKHPKVNNNNPKLTRITRAVLALTQQQPKADGFDIGAVSALAHKL